MSGQRITDEEALAAKVAYDKAGSYSAAAEMLGLSTTSFSRRLEKSRQLTQVATRDNSRTKLLETLVAQQSEMLAASSKPVRSQRRPKRQKTTGDFIRIAIPDTHGSHIDWPAAEALLRDIESVKPREIILLGDHLDCGGFLAQHHTLGYVAETRNSFSQDVRAAREFLDAVQSAAPEAEIFYLEGNHERRIEQWCVTQTLKNGNPEDTEFVSSLFNTSKVLGLEERGIKFYAQGKCYDGLRIPATIKRGSCYFTHGTRTGVHAAKQTLSDFGGNVVFGHTHRIQQHQTWLVDGGDISAWNVGFLSKVQPYWRHSSPTGWSHGYGIQFVSGDGNFLHLTVPILNGNSYLAPLASNIR